MRFPFCRFQWGSRSEGTQGERKDGMREIIEEYGMAVVYVMFGILVLMGFGMVLAMFSTY